LDGELLDISLGRLMTGNFCDVDAAVSKFERAAGRMEQHATWNWFIARVQELEGGLDAVGGCDAGLVDSIESDARLFWTHGTC